MVKLHGAVSARDSLTNQPPAQLRRLPQTASHPGTKPDAAAAKKRSPPITVGRVVYFSTLVAFGLMGLYWLGNHILYVKTVAIVARDIDRLGPRERGRIVRLAVKAGDRVTAGEPLAWLDYSASDGEIPGAGLLSADAARAASRQVQLLQMRLRRAELDRQVAMTRSTIAALHAQVEGLQAQRAPVLRSQMTAARLRSQGAATDAEVMQYDLKLAQLDQDKMVADRQAREQSKALAVLSKEAVEIEEALREPTLVAPPLSDPGVITAYRDGTVADVPRHEGEVVAPGDPIVLVVDDRTVRFVAYVSPFDAQSIAIGRPARVLIPTGEALMGEVVNLHPLASTTFTQEPPALANRVALDIHLPPVDPEATFLLVDVSVKDLPEVLSKRLVTGSPTEVWVRRAHPWLDRWIHP